MRHVDNFLSISLKGGGGLIVLEFMSTPIGTKKNTFSNKTNQFLVFLSFRKKSLLNESNNELFIEKDTL